MAHILADILTLLQYQSFQKEEINQNRLERCPDCGKLTPWLHGFYPRKSDRNNKEEGSLNPILIQRYYCHHCGKTCSVLPECIPPHRWYLWEVQQAALALLLADKSAYAAAKEIGPSRHTIVRWLAYFKAQFHIQKDALCTHIVDLGRVVGFSDFWAQCFSVMPLSKAMRLCHAAGVTIP